MRLLALSLVALAACATGTPSVSPEGAKVAASEHAPPTSCTRLREVYGKGGSEVGGTILANDEIVDYAMVDMMNHTAQAGGNYVQYELPVSSKMAEPLAITTGASVKGVAYRCDPSAIPR